MEQSTYNMYDLNKAYESFVGRFGIEPNGLLMSEETFQMLKEAAESMIIKIEPIYRGKPVYRSSQMEYGKLRFII